MRRIVKPNGKVAIIACANRGGIVKVFSSNRKGCKVRGTRLNKATFLDRDGVINKVFLNNGKPFSPRTFSEFELFPEVENALRFFKEAGFLNIVITNQPDIARGFLRREELEKMHSHIRERVSIDDIFVCPHSDEDNCLCRKPKPGALFEAAKNWNIDLKRSFFIGDTWKDAAAGKSAGCKTILIDMPYNQGVESDYRVKALDKVVEIIQNSNSKIRK